MKTSTADIQNIFSSIASRYDSLNSILTLNIDRLWRKKAIKLCDLKKGDKVLDLCCGTGQMVQYACRGVGKDTEVVGLDFNSDMLQVGFERLNSSIGDFKYKLVQGDVQKLPFENESFDSITIAFGLRNVPDKDKALSEMYRVLKPGGRLVCLELSTPTTPVFKEIYAMYFNHILPAIGFLGTGSKQAYTYLRDSVNGFMSKEELKARLLSSGFINASYVSLTAGAASIHYGVKPI